MVFKRNLKRGMSGSDVRYMKDLLFQGGYYAPTVLAIRKDNFGDDTLRAVRAFQRVNVDANGKRLAVDGVIGRKTWAAIELGGTIERDESIPLNIGPAAARAIAPELMRVSEPPRQLMLEALSFAFDPAVPSEFPLSLYIRGGNLYNTDLRLNVITPARIESGAKRQPQYYSNGRKAMMLRAVEANPEITGADCSGGIVGLLRSYGLVKPSFDVTADMFNSNQYSRKIAASELLPGDFVGRPGHIGLYAGGGYVVEWMGGAYGCQLSRLSARSGFNFVTQRTRRQSAWTKYRRPSFY